MAQGVVLFFHNLFTVVWIGGLSMLALTVIPALRKRVRLPKEEGQGKAIEFFQDMTLRHQIGRASCRERV